MSKLLWNAALFVLAVPVYLVAGSFGLVRRLKFIRVMRSRTLSCPTCGGNMLLLGFWKCSCGFTYRGHVLRLCPVCGTLPQVVRCEHCGATERIRR